MDSKEDDEISIDFSKIKSFFKSEKKEEAKSESAVKEEQKKDDDEISIDFKKIKSFFKSDKKEPGSSEEEISVNWGNVSSFFKRYGIIFIALIPIILSIYIRMQAGDLHFAEGWAASNVMAYYSSQIKNSIDQQYPNLPAANKNALIDAELQKMISQNKAEIDRQVLATSNSIKSFFQDDNGKNYMPDIDPYYWFRYAKNIIDHGYPGDILKEGKRLPDGSIAQSKHSFDTYQLAPAGRFVTADFFHIYFLAYFYKVLNFFDSDITLMRSIFYYPVFVSALCVLLVFLIGRRIAGNAGGFFAALMMAITPAVLGRTLFGHGDSDAWVIFFPLMVTWLIILAEESKSMLKLLMLTVFAGFFTGLYTLSWSGWWYIFDFILATIGLIFVYLTISRFREIRNSLNIFFSNNDLRNLIILGIVYFISTAAFAVMFSGWYEFGNSFLGPFSFSSIKAPVTRSLWPNVLTTVAELNEGSVDGIINSIGGAALFFIGLIGLLFSVSRKEGLKLFDVIYIAGSILFYITYFAYRRLGYGISVFGLLAWIALPIIVWVFIAIFRKDASYNFKMPILLSLWIISTIYASIKGIRFTLLLAPAFSVAFGVAFGKIYTYVSMWISKELKVHKFVISAVMIALLLILYVDPIKGALSTARSDIPLINDAWYNTLNSIKINSSQNAIITSWWDFGHHFKALADRPVTFDGTTQTSTPAHWVGRFFMSSDENEARGILRMLDCGNHKAFGYLESSINNDTHAALKLLKEIILLDKNGAKKRLEEYKLNSEQIDKLLSFTHCSPPEAFIIASEDMIGKSGVWSHFGSWNFERADLWYNAAGKPQEAAVQYMVSKFNYTKDRAEQVYEEMQDIKNEPDSNKRDSLANGWVAPWPGYGGTIGCSKNKEEIYSCSNGLQVNLSNYDVYGITQEGIIRPKMVAFTTEDGLFIKEFGGNTKDFGITLIPKNEDELLAVLSSKELTGSMFTRMFYMKGHGLKYFNLFNHQRGLTGTDIFTYKVDWEGKDINIVEDYIIKSKKEELKPDSTNEVTANTTTNNS